MEVDFGEPVYGFTEQELEISGFFITARITRWSGSDGSETYTATVATEVTEGRHSGDVTFSVAEGAAHDEAGNPSTPDERYMVIFVVQEDNERPYPTIIVPTEKQDGAFEVTIEFSEFVSGFTQDDIDLRWVPIDGYNPDNRPTSQLTIEDWTAHPDGTRYTFTLKSSSPLSGWVHIKVPENVAQDEADNENFVAINKSVKVIPPAELDTTPPSVMIDGPTNPPQGPFDVTISFSEVVTGFTQDDIDLWCTASPSFTAWAPSSDGRSYTATITPRLPGSVRIDVPENVAKDSAGNWNTALDEPKVFRPAASYNFVTIIVPRDTQRGPFDVTVRFNQPVTGFVQSELGVSGAGASITAWDPDSDERHYTATITPTTGGEVKLTVNADVTIEGNRIASPEVVIILPEDVNQDGHIDELDLFRVASHFGQSPDGDIRYYDVDRDGDIDTSDFRMVMGRLGQSVSPGNTEPDASLTLKDTLQRIKTLNIADPDFQSLIQLLEKQSKDTQQTELASNDSTSLDPVEIGDSNLAAVIRETLGLDADAEITDTDMADLTELVASDRRITDIAGLEHATNLTELDLRDNEITDIGALSGLTGLTFLHLGGNSISDLSALSDLTNLTHLYLGRNSISDLSALSNLTNLTHFSLGRGAVTDIRALSGLTNLVRLYLERNTISDLTPLTDLTALKYLYLNRNNISDVSPLAGLVNLEILRLSHNPILDTSPLYALLEATGGKLSDVNITITEYPPWDVNEDGVVDATDSALVTAALGQNGNDIVNPRTDVNGDATVDADDLTLVTEHLDAGAAPSSREVFTLLDRATLETLDPDTLAAQLASLRAKSDGSLKYQRAIALLESVLAAMRPDKTKLLANYPNPFNPETWIPYHLAKASDVKITIYDARGAVVRRLDLGHQREGYYINRSRAAHWDGRNAIGERVASGLYLYQLQADNMSLLRKMVILK